MVKGDVQRNSCGDSRQLCSTEPSGLMIRLKGEYICVTAACTVGCLSLSPREFGETLNSRCRKLLSESMIFGILLSCEFHESWCEVWSGLPIKAKQLESYVESRIFVALCVTKDIPLDRLRATRKI